MFRAKKIEIDASYELIALLNEEDAKNLSLSPQDRVKIINEKNNKSVICVLEVIDKKKIGAHKDFNLKKAELGIYEKPFEKLDILEGDEIVLIPAKKPTSLDYVKEKFEGKKLNRRKFLEITKDIVDNTYSLIETTYFVLACTINKLDDKETADLALAMVDVGKALDFTKNGSEIVVDKHCIGGLAANRTTMVVVPIIAAAGLKIPKTSSRAITSPAGTADTMEVLANVGLSLTRMHDIVEKENGCIVWGGGLDLSPADDLIIQVEHPLEIDSEGQMIASILSKKKSVGSTHVLIDIPVGPTAKVNDTAYAKRLSRRFIKIGKAIGLNIKTIITDGTQPIGNGIGPLYEAQDVIKVLKDTSDAPDDLREKSLRMAGIILEMSKKAKTGKGYDMAKEIVESKKAYHKFEQIIELQGKKSMPKDAKFSYKIHSPKNSYVKQINNKYLSKLAFILGAPKDKSAGIRISKKIGDKINKGDKLFEIYTNSELKLNYAKAYIKEHQIYLTK